MRISILIFSIVLICGCGRQENKKTFPHTNSGSVKFDTSSLTTECIQRDTVTEMGTKIYYLYLNGKFQISWGDNTYNRIYDSLYTCYYDKSTGLWDFVPKIFSETKNYLVFTNVLWTSSGGNPAPLEYYAIVCPKNIIDNVFERDFFIDSSGEYLIYGDHKNENLHLLNIETKKCQTVFLKPRPEQSRSPTISILKTEIKGKSFFVIYKSLDKNDEVINIERKFNIEI